MSSMPNEPTEHRPDTLSDARRHLRRFTRGVLRRDDEIVQTRFVFDGRDGAVVFPADLDEITDAVLYVPDDGFDDMALLLDAEPFPASFDEVKDRHQAYHGRCRESDWFRARVDSVKWKGAVFEGDDLVAPNPLRAGEPGLVRTLNADRDRLAEVAHLLTGVRPQEGVCVGVDPLGMDIRTRVGVVRVEWPREIEAPEQAAGVVNALLRDDLSAPHDPVPRDGDAPGAENG
jgi:hypothetical protein